jgi:hypothetical protein
MLCWDDWCLWDDGRRLWHLCWRASSRGLPLIRDRFQASPALLAGLAKQTRSPFKSRTIAKKNKMNKFNKAFYKKKVLTRTFLKAKTFCQMKFATTMFWSLGAQVQAGSSCAKQSLKFKPRKTTAVDIDENGLIESTGDLRSFNLLGCNPEHITHPVNLLSGTFDKIFKSESWQAVANFSAHKHARSEKDKISAEALMKNNVHGAIKLLNLCEQNPPNCLFGVSADEAADPANIMGASKSLMEKLISSKKNNFRVSTARFANVAFSNGSSLDGFVCR